MGGGIPEHDLLTVRQAADLWGVSPGTVYHWISGGILTCFGKGGERRARAAREDIRRAQVLSKREMVALGVPPERLEQAVRRGIVRPTQGRYSLVDLETTTHWAATRDPSASQARPPRYVSGFVRKPVPWTAQDEIAWADRGAEATELPEGYFDLPSPPRLIQPPGVWKYSFDGRVPGTPGARYVRRSAGYERRGDTLVWCEEDDRFATLGPQEPMPQEWIDSNCNYRLAEDRWL